MRENKEQAAKEYERQVDYLERMARDSREKERKGLEREGREWSLYVIAIASLAISFVSFLKDEIKALVRWVIGNF